MALVKKRELLSKKECILIKSIAALPSGERKQIVRTIPDRLLHIDIFRSFADEVLQTDSDDFPLEVFLVKNSVAESGIIHSAEPVIGAEAASSLGREIAKSKIIEEIGRVSGLKNISVEEKEKSIDSLKEELRSIRGERSKNGARDLVDRYFGHIDEASEQYENSGGIIGIPSGIVELDVVTRGLKKKDMAVLAARPSMGKTSLSLNYFLEAIERGDNPVYFSLEMPAEHLMAKLISLKFGIPTEETMYGSKGRKRPAEAAEYFRDKKFWIEDFSSRKHRGGITTLNIEAALSEIEGEGYNPGLIVVDYIQLLSSKNKMVFDQNSIVSEISGDLKRIAVSYDSAILALSQLNRSLDSRVDKRPIMSDLRSSGAIEQDADIIIFLYRPEVYLATELKKMIESGEGDTDFYKERLKRIEESDTTGAEFIVGKNRNGPVGTAYGEFVKRTTSFRGVAKDEAFEAMMKEAFGV